MDSLRDPHLMSEKSFLLYGHESCSICNSTNVSKCQVIVPVEGAAGEARACDTTICRECTRSYSIKKADSILSQRSQSLIGSTPGQELEAFPTESVGSFNVFLSEMVPQDIESGYKQCPIAACYKCCEQLLVLNRTQLKKRSPKGCNISACGGTAILFFIVVCIALPIILSFLGLLHR